MRAARVHQFGSPDVILLEELEPPRPAEGEVVVRVHAAGVGPWDAWIRSGQSVLPQPLPLTLGSDLSGVVVELGANVAELELGQAVFGVTNKQFTGAYADYAVASASMIAPKPVSLGHAYSAGVPVVAVTALQMLGDLRPGQRVLVLGAGGNVGAYAVQLALLAGAHVIGADLAAGLAYAAELGVHDLIDTASARIPGDLDVVIDTVGGEIAVAAIGQLIAGGTLISSVARPRHERRDVRAEFMLVDVTTQALRTIAAHLDQGHLVPRVGSVLPLTEARTAHRMLAGSEPHRPGKIVLDVSGATTARRPATARLA
jgi:NADPH:quinone reductase-like Zn-dependent oxidoreductase